MISVGFMRPPERIADAEKLIKSRGMEPYGAASLIPIRAEDSVFEKTAEELSSGEVYFTIFASISAVETACAYYGKERLLALLNDTNVACAGSSTEKALDGLIGRKCDVVPEEYSGVGIAKEIVDRTRAKTVLVIRSAGGDREMNDMLLGAGANVLDRSIYSMAAAPFSSAHSRLYDALGNGRLDVVLFTSPRTFSLFVDQAEGWLGKKAADSELRDVAKMAIGKPTASAMEKTGYAPELMPEKSTFEGMLDAVEKHFA